MPDTASERRIPLTLTGRTADPGLPSILRGATRATPDGSEREDIFLPAGYLAPTASFDVSPAARSGLAGASATSHTHWAEPDEVVVLELADGGTLITSAERLRESLRVASPGLLVDERVLLEKLRAASAAPSRAFGEAVKGVISKIYLLRAGNVKDAIVDAALEKFKAKGIVAAGGWFGTRMLMQAIEERLDQQPGLYRWVGASGKPSDLVPVQLVDQSDTPQADPARNPMLVFVHGTGSSTLGSFGNLRSCERDLWGTLERKYGDRIYAFEHRTLSESPIENAIALARALPRGAHVSLASHSRGGLVCDLLCLDEFDALIDNYRYAFQGSGTPLGARVDVRQELEAAHAEQRDQLRELAGVIRKRKLVIERYVRTACPANGTVLASGNFDVFLSGLLTLIGAVPFFFGNPLYSAFKRMVIEIAKNRTDAHMVPGIEAQLPDSPLAQLLHDAGVQPGIAMAVVAGDVAGGNMLSRLGVLLTDFLLFDKEDNDLVVNTPAMLAGIAPQAGARVLFDRGADVSHFRYFSNVDTRGALRDWFTHDAPEKLPGFRRLPDPAEYAAALMAAARSRDAADAKKPVVVVLPGIMGSHLAVNRSDRVWFDPLDIARGGLDRISWGQPGVEAWELFEMSYGEACAHLSRTHRVERFPYDWRQPLDVLGERLGEFLDQLLKQTGDQVPIRLLAHSMGGLVVRACIYKRGPVMDTLMAREGARLIMLGTPNQGAHSMVENLIGKGDTLRTLVRLDFKHDMQQVLDTVSAFRGALQLLPKPGFEDTFQGDGSGGHRYDYQKARTWTELKSKLTDFWFGDGRCGTPSQEALDAGAWLWERDQRAVPALPLRYEKKSIYLFGVARNTVCGVREEPHNDGTRIRMVGTTRGDGTVTWDSGRIGGIGSFYYMPVQHGDMLSTAEHFKALTELLQAGGTTLLSQQPPATRAAEPHGPVIYDAGPPTTADADAAQRTVAGASLRNRLPARSRRRLAVAVKAMDLRFLAKPIMVGHYEQDPIAGPEALIDRELLGGDLSKRYNLGLYAGPRGTTTVVLRTPAEGEQRRGYLTGAVVTGLGRYEGTLSAADLTEAVHTGALRYLLQVVDVLGKEDREVSLASLLLGYNSSANLSPAASVEAMVRGVMQANVRFCEITGLNIRIGSLDIVELYIDTAISAVYALRQMEERLRGLADKHGTALVVCRELLPGEGMRHRLISESVSSYWPRLVVTDADRSDEPVMAAARRVGDPPPATMVADRLRFMYVGTRARAEAVVQQRQPGLVEALVKQQISDPVWDEDFGRMLFQLMVPHDFKDAARQLDRVVMVVDSQTANLPWELMLADGPARADERTHDDERLPLSLKAAMVRQLSSTHFRPQVLQSGLRNALVIGNPSVQGFEAAFGPAGAPSLPGAAREAAAVADALAKIGYKVEPVIGVEGGELPAASTVLATLYREPWRILHIAGHGVFDLPHADGRRRSGVLLSDGLLITAAEIAAMEVVPDLVFLNCCHLGQVDGGRNSNKLAGSVARELIDIGVRCVVVAGWAVNDVSALRFGEAFYKELLARRQPFGMAVFRARRTTRDASPSDITWGAYQAYGDPGWMPEALASDTRGAEDTEPYAAIEELLDDLARTRVRLSHQRDAAYDYDTHAIAERVDLLLNERCPLGWRDLPQLHSALGLTRFELNQLEMARDEFVEAIRCEDERGSVPIRDIERLVDVEALLGERYAAEAVGTGNAERLETAERMIDLALGRLDGLDALAIDADGAAGSAPSVNCARSALRGRVWKSKASLRAHELLSSGPRANARNDMEEYLAKAVKAYQEAEGSPGSGHFAPELALNRLALDALTPWKDDSRRDAAVALALHCSQSADRELAEGVSASALIHPKALLVEHLIQGSLQDGGDAGHVAVESVLQAYADATSNIALKPTEIGSIAAEIESIALLCDAMSTASQADGAMHQTSTWLRELTRRLQRGYVPKAEYLDAPASEEVRSSAASAMH